MSSISRPGHRSNLIGSLFANLYGWLLAAYFGTIVLDVLYSRTVKNVLPSAETDRVFSAVSDFLLLPFFLSAFAAVGAAMFAVTRRASIMISASAAVLFAQVPVYFLFGPLLEQMNLGTSARVILSGAASMLALGGVVRFHRAE
jgi:membrane-bound metal-dependent hydrolase YbcI (DUF457 family)